MLRKISFRYATAYLISSALIILLVCGAKVNITAPTQEALTTIFEQREKSEDAVTEGKERFKKDPERLQELRRLYNTTVAKGNAFIGIIQLNLTAGILQESNLEPRAKEIVEAVENLEKYAYPPSRKAVGPMISLADIISGLVKAGLDIWKETKNQKASVIKDIKEELEKHKWKKFEDLSK